MDVIEAQICRRELFAPKAGGCQKDNHKPGQKQRIGFNFDPPRQSIVREIADALGAVSNRFIVLHSGACAYCIKNEVRDG